MNILLLDDVLPPELYQKEQKKWLKQEKKEMKKELKEEKKQLKKLQKEQKRKAKEIKKQVKKGVFGKNPEDNTLNLIERPDNTSEQVATQESNSQQNVALASASLSTIIFIGAALLLCATSAMLYRKKSKQ
jgi:seryl-tRNA synthetase